jgi:hypothetical protein
MGRSKTAAAVRRRKEERPELYCPEPHCLWYRPDGSYCPRHQRLTTLQDVSRLLNGLAPRTGAC